MGGVGLYIVVCLRINDFLSRVRDNCSLYTPRLTAAQQTVAKAKQLIDPPHLPFFGRRFFCDSPLKINYQVVPCWTLIFLFADRSKYELSWERSALDSKRDAENNLTSPNWPEAQCCPLSEACSVKGMVQPQGTALAGPSRLAAPWGSNKTSPR